MRTEKSHFWIGRFESEEIYFEFVEEDDNRYELDDYDDVPISKFVGSQGEVWIDHDFMESGFELPQASLAKQFEKYSYSYNWGAELEKKSVHFKLNHINVLIFINEDQIENPKSVEESGFKLIYLGVIEYEI